MTTEYMKQAEAVLDVIERNPKKHDQDSWGTGNECGTTACVAGHVALLNGDATYVEYGPAEFILTLSPEYASFDHYAANKLGLGRSDMFRLFYVASNAQAKEALKYLAKGEDIPWDTIIGY